MKKLGHLAHVIVHIDIIHAIFELIAEVLNSSIEQLAPFLGIKRADQLLALRFSDKVVEDVEAWNCSAPGNLRIWKVDNGAFLEIILL